jgi:hypothetical protein
MTVETKVKPDIDEVETGVTLGMQLLNSQISSDLITLNNTFGNLLVHVSGEGKVDFSGAGAGWLGMIKYIISGDIGCMKPYKGYDTCALDNAIEFLLNLDTVPHLNSSAFEEFTITPEKWREFVLSIKEDCSFVGDFKNKYVYTLRGGDKDVPVVTVRLEPLCNEFVIGEFTASQKCEFLGTLEDWDQPKIKSAFVMVNGAELELQLERLIHFRHRLYQPRRGDYLLYDKEKDVYIILPQEDYSIH